MRTSASAPPISPGARRQNESVTPARAECYWACYSSPVVDKNARLAEVRWWSRPQDPDDHVILTSIFKLFPQR